VEAAVEVNSAIQRFERRRLPAVEMSRELTLPPCEERIQFIILPFIIICTNRSYSELSSLYDAYHTSTLPDFYITIVLCHLSLFCATYHYLCRLSSFDATCHYFMPLFIIRCDLPVILCRFSLFCLTYEFFMRRLQSSVNQCISLTTILYKFNDHHV
jgi:hypothetical protein